MNRKPYPIYLVSLDQDSAKREILKQRFPRHYSKMKRVNAVDGRKLSAQEFFDYIVTPIEYGHRLMLPGEVGCSLSHIHALESFLDSESDAALILEDDVIGDDSSIDAVLELTPSLPSEALMICGGQEGMPARKYIFGKETSTEGLYRLPPYSNSHIFRTCCYVVTQVSAKQILDVQKQSMELADAWGKFFRGTMINIYYTNRLSHPKELAASHLEQDRSRLGNKSTLRGAELISRVKRRGSRLARKLGALFCLVQGYRRVVK